MTFYIYDFIQRKTIEYVVFQLDHENFLRVCRDHMQIAALHFSINGLLLVADYTQPQIPGSPRIICPRDKEFCQKIAKMVQLANSGKV